ncbi:MAG: hypothetical protein AB7Y46_15930 [Armatimonadota bacterium]
MSVAYVVHILQTAAEDLAAEGYNRHVHASARIRRGGDDVELRTEASGCTDLIAGTARRLLEQLAVGCNDGHLCARLIGPDGHQQVPHLVGRAVAHSLGGSLVTAERNGDGGVVVCVDVPR